MDKKLKQPKNDRFLRVTVPILIVGVILILWIIFGFMPIWAFQDINNASTFAGSFAFADTLFAALAFGGVIYAILLQSRELELQRKELKSTRKELKRSAKAQVSTERALFLSAYLNTISSTLQAYSPHIEGKHFNPSKMEHLNLTLQLQWLLREMAGNKEPPKRLPSTIETIDLQLQTLSGHFANFAEHHILRGHFDEVGKGVRQLDAELSQLLPLLGESDNDPVLQQGLTDIIRKCRAYNVATPIRKDGVMLVPDQNPKRIEVSTVKARELVKEITLDLYNLSIDEYVPTDHSIKTAATNQ